MHFLVKASIPVEVGNRKMRDGTLGATTDAILKVAKPEAVYFSDVDGVRTIYTIMNVTDAGDLSPVLEAWYLGVSASVEVRMACTPEDMAKAGPKMPGVVTQFA